MNEITLKLTPDQLGIIMQAVGEVPARIGGRLLVQLENAAQDFQREAARAALARDAPKPDNKEG